MENGTADEPEKRAFHEKFTLKSREYKLTDIETVVAGQNTRKLIKRKGTIKISALAVLDA